MLKYILLTFYIVALLPCQVYSQSNENAANQLHIHAIQNPILPELISYTKYKENSVQISRISEAAEYEITTICQKETINDGWGEEVIDIESLGCSSFEWRPVIDEEDNFYYSLVSRIENKIYIGFINENMECGNEYSCGFQMLSTNLEETFNIQRPVWSPDGTMLLFEADGSIFLIEGLHDLNNIQNRTFTPTRVIEKGSYPQWSPDQRFITYEHEDDIFIMYADELWNNESENNVFSVDDNFPIDSEYAKFRPSWSTDGKLISYFVEDSTNVDSYTWNILVRELLEEDGRIVLQNYGGERFQVGDVYRGSNALMDGPIIIASAAKETENKSYYSTYIDNNADEDFPVMMKELVAGTERPEYWAISDSTSHLNNDMLNVQVDESTVYFAYSSQIRDSTKSGLEINYESIENQSLSFNEGIVYKEMNRGTALRRSAVFPGLGQLYKDERIKAYSFIAGAGVLLGSAIRFGMKANSEKNDYDDLLEQYNQLNSTQFSAEGNADYRELNSRLNNADDNRRSYNNRQALSLGAFMLLYAYNIYDAQNNFPIFRSYDFKLAQRDMSLSLSPYMNATNNTGIHSGISLTLSK